MAKKRVGQGALGELDVYIKDGLRKGYHLKEIRRFLVKEGVSEGLVDRAMKGFSGGAGLREWSGTFFILVGMLLVVAIAGTLTFYVFLSGDSSGVGSGGGSGGSEISGTGGEIETEGEMIDDNDIGDGEENGLVDGGLILESTEDSGVGLDSLLLQAIEEEDYTYCDTLPIEKAILSCKIRVAVEKGNEEICNEDFEFFEDFDSFLSGTNIIPLNSDDYCWIKMTEFSGDDYCENISSEEGKEACLLLVI